MGLLDFDYSQTDDKVTRIKQYCKGLGDCSPKCKIYDICTSLDSGLPNIPLSMLDEAYLKVKDLVIE